MSKFGKLVFLFMTILSIYIGILSGSLIDGFFQYSFGAFVMYICLCFVEDNDDDGDGE